MQATHHPEGQPSAAWVGVPPVPAMALGLTYKGIMTFLPAYLGEQYCTAFAAVRQGECDDFHTRISNLDYEWYLRAV